jgi:hypothetical protein
MTTLRSLSPLLLACVLATTLLGCAVESDDHPGAWQGQSQAPLSARDDAPKPCTSGSQRACTISVEQANGVRACWKGVQFCVDAAWSDCIELDQSSPSSPN